MEGAMNIESIVSGQAYLPRSAGSIGADRVERTRETASDQATEAAATQTDKVQPEELLQNIKALTDGGAYSVRFEMHKDTNDMIINLVEQKTGEVIRQIPPEEILGLHKMLSDLRGNLVQTES
jgi:flagellar protein FlaG